MTGEEYRGDIDGAGTGGSYVEMGQGRWERKFSQAPLKRDSSVIYLQMERLELLDLLDGGK